MIMTRSKTRKDKFSELPLEIWLYIMSFLNIQDAVRTCVLSKSWKNLWKFLPNLTLHSAAFSNYTFFYEFVSGIVSCRDGNHLLRILDFDRHNCFKSEIMKNLMNYAVSHKIQQLRVYVPFNIALPACVFSCRSLTYLSISVSFYDFKRRTQIPNSLKLPALLSLHLDNVAISADRNGHAEPFSTCKNLNTLYLKGCSVLYPNAINSNGSEVLHITNATVRNLITNYTLCYKTVISAPNLSYFTFNGAPFQTLRGQAAMKVEIQSSSLI